MQPTSPAEHSYPERAADGIAQAKSEAVDAAQKAVDEIDSKRGKVARGMESAAASLRDRADRLPGGGKVARAAHVAAGAMESTADYVRDHDLKSAASDARRVVKKYPGATLLTIAALGFLIARSFSRKS